MPAKDLERTFFRALTALTEPLVRGGIGSPTVCPTGVILLETTGRRSGRPHRTPVLAYEGDGYLPVSTTRARSDWMKNLRAHPSVRYWLRGARHDAEAFVFGPDHSPGDAPAFVGDIASTVQPVARAAGMRFAVLIARG
jgi:deazaflavin-dependent oxidoreductase (nitroreductase family)